MGIQSYFALEMRNSSAKDILLKGNNNTSRAVQTLNSTYPVLGWSNGVVAEGVWSAVGVVGVGGVSGRTLASSCTLLDIYMHTREQ